MTHLEEKCIVDMAQLVSRTRFDIKTLGSCQDATHFSLPTVYLFCVEMGRKMLYLLKVRKLFIICFVSSRENSLALLHL